MSYRFLLKSHSILACLFFLGLCAGDLPRASAQDKPAVDPAPRQISGVYPHLTTYGVYSQDGAHRLGGHDECGIGAVVPWADRLWMVNYAPHMPRGSEHKLFSIDNDLKMTIHPESVGGTPAGRMIHRESNQLLIAHYLIDTEGKVRVISPKDMPARVTAIARHLTDPKSKVYYYDMEGMLYEVNVHTLAVEKLFQKPVPGWHGKGAYTAQGRLVVANNGEHAAGSYKPLLVGGAAQHRDEAGVLASWNGETWKIIERRQYTDVTGPGGIHGAADDNAPLWAIGWDRRSLRLKLLDQGTWHTFLLPKATHNNDARHGWYTEWPRIREIGDGRAMMDMHGMFFDFPLSFAADNTAGITPIGSHLRYIPDFCQWNGQLVLASDETSIQGNRLAGQPQSNLWFGSYEELKTWGPATGYGGPWVGDKVKADTPSEPFLVAGFDHRLLHLAVGAAAVDTPDEEMLRTTDQQKIHKIPARLAQLPRVTVRRGDYHQPGRGFSFSVDHPVTIYLAVDERGDPKLDKAWKQTEWRITWGNNHRDTIFRRDFDAGRIEIPTNATEHIQGDFGMPHMALIAARQPNTKITPHDGAQVSARQPATAVEAASAEPVKFTLEVDPEGRGDWKPYTTLEVPANEAVAHLFPENFDAVWVRLQTDRDCRATAYFHLTDADHHQPETNRALWNGLADVGIENVRAAHLYAAKRNRNLRLITSDGRPLEFHKGSFTFSADQPDEQLSELLRVDPEFTVDAASVIVRHRGRRLRLPKGDARFDRPFAFGWPRGSREVESERHLANLHGTFYEVPLITNGAPPAFDLMRPVASHNKQIADFCTWNGLLVLSGVRADAADDGHLYSSAEHDAGLWFGGIDDLWKFGKPVGQGGPWKETKVTAGAASDAYLMTGYDRKTLSLTADADTTVTVEVDIDHQTGWHTYRTFRLTAGETLTYEFPAGYSAHWLRVRADVDCTATAWLVYE